MYTYVESVQKKTKVQFADLKTGLAGKYTAKLRAAVVQAKIQQVESVYLVF